MTSKPVYVKVRKFKSGMGSFSLYILIPKKIAKELGIEPDDYVKLEVKGSSIILSKPNEKIIEAGVVG